MSWERCKKCGKPRKVDIMISEDGWDQPPCYHCGDPGYIEPLLETCQHNLLGVAVTPDRKPYVYCLDCKTDIPLEKRIGRDYEYDIDNNIWVSTKEPE